MAEDSRQTTARAEGQFPDPSAFPEHWIRRRHVRIEGPEEARALAADLARAIEGEVRFGDGDRALYAADAGNYR